MSSRIVQFVPFPSTFARIFAPLCLSLVVVACEDGDEPADLDETGDAEPSFDAIGDLDSTNPGQDDSGEGLDCENEIAVVQSVDGVTTSFCAVDGGGTYVMQTGHGRYEGATYKDISITGNAVLDLYLQIAESSQPVPRALIQTDEELQFVHSQERDVVDGAVLQPGAAHFATTGDTVTYHHCDNNLTNAGYFKHVACGDMADLVINSDWYRAADWCEPWLNTWVEMEMSTHLGTRGNETWVHVESCFNTTIVRIKEKRSDWEIVKRAEVPANHWFRWFYIGGGRDRYYMTRVDRDVQGASFRATGAFGDHNRP